MPRVPCTMWCFTPVQVFHTAAPHQGQGMILQVINLPCNAAVMSEEAVEHTWLLGRRLSCGPLALICFGLQAHRVLLRLGCRATRLDIGRSRAGRNGFCYAGSCRRSGFPCPGSCGRSLCCRLSYTLLFSATLHQLSSSLSYQKHVAGFCAVF